MKGITLFHTIFIYFSVQFVFVHSALTKENIMITVKTSQKFEHTRLPIIFDTWLKLAKNQIWFITDVGNTTQFKLFQSISNNHMVATECGKSHSKVDLCCKTNAELNQWNSSNETDDIRWLCLFDDDNYVNVPNLVKKLKNYDYKKSWYLGRRFYMNEKQQSRKKFKYDVSKSFYFATLGAGACLSKDLLIRIQPFIRNDSFVQMCKYLGEPDDVTLGYLCEMKLGVNLTHMSTFHSQYENLGNMPVDELKKQISFGYHKMGSIKVQGFFSGFTDRSRLPLWEKFKDLIQN